jgi:hypothetical protein
MDQIVFIHPSVEVALVYCRKNRLPLCLQEVSFYGGIGKQPTSSQDRIDAYQI